METYKLTVIGVKRCERKPFGPRYAWQTGEIDEVYLNITAQDAEGHTVWFNAGAIERRVTCGGPAAVVTYDKSNAWLLSPEAYVVTANMPARPGSGQFEPQVQTGDTLIVKGKVKKTYSTGSYVLSHVKLVEVQR